MRHCIGICSVLHPMRVALPGTVAKLLWSPTTAQACRQKHQGLQAAVFACSPFGCQPGQQDCHLASATAVGQPLGPQKASSLHDVITQAAAAWPSAMHPHHTHKTLAAYPQPQSPAAGRAELRGCCGPSPLRLHPGGDCSASKGSSGSKGGRDGSQQKHQA